MAAAGGRSAGYPRFTAGIMLEEGSYEARIAAVVRRHLEKRFEGRVSFDAVMVSLRTDQWGDDCVHVYVVYDGNGEPLDIRWLSGIRNRMRRELRDLGADVVMTTSYIDRSELEPLLDLVASPDAADESRELPAAAMDGPLSQGICNLCRDMVNDLTARGHLMDCIARQDLPKASGTDPTEHEQSLHLSVNDGNSEAFLIVVNHPLLYWPAWPGRTTSTRNGYTEYDGCRPSDAGASGLP